MAATPADVSTPGFIAALDACTEALYSSSVQAERERADSQLSRVFGGAGAPAGASCHVVAAQPACLALHRAVLDASSSPLTAVFSMGSLTMMADTNVLRGADEKWELRSLVLAWLASKGPGSDAGAAATARVAAITCVVRVTKLGWRDDSRHHLTARHCLQFLAPRAHSHWTLGLDLWARFVDDMQRPHALLPERPTVRLLTFRDLALRPLHTRLVGLLQELLAPCQVMLTALVAAQQQRAAGGVGGGGGAAWSANAAEASYGELLPRLAVAGRALALAEQLLCFNFACSSSSRGSGDDDDDDDGTGGDSLNAAGSNDSEPAQLPSSWPALRQPGALLVHFAWMRFFASAHAHLAAAAALDGGGLPAGAPAFLDAVLQGGARAIRCCASVAGSKCVLWGSRMLRLRRRVLLQQCSFLMAHLLGSPRAQELVDAGWAHEAARLIFRFKLTMPLTTLANPHDTLAPFARLVAHFSYALLRSGAGRGAGGAALAARAPSAFGAPALPLAAGPAGFAPHLPAVGSNTIYYLLSFWVLIILPVAHLPPYESASRMLRSALAPLCDALLDRFVPLSTRPPRRSGGSAPPAGGSLGDDDGDASGSDDEGEWDEEGDECGGGVGDDAQGLTASGGHGGDTVEDDTIELAAEVVRFHAAHAAHATRERLKAWVERLRAATDTRSAGRAQRRLAWLVRFAALLTTTTLSGEDDEEGSINLGTLPHGSPALSLLPEDVAPSVALMVAAVARTTGAGQHLLRQAPHRRGAPAPAAATAAQAGGGFGLPSLQERRSQWRRAAGSDFAGDGRHASFGQGGASAPALPSEASQLADMVEGLGMGSRPPPLRAPAWPQPSEGRAHGSALDDDDAFGGIGDGDDGGSGHHSDSDVEDEHVDSGGLFHEDADEGGSGVDGDALGLLFVANPEASDPVFARLLFVPGAITHAPSAPRPPAFGALPLQMATISEAGAWGRGLAPPAASALVVGDDDDLGAYGCDDDESCSSMPPLEPVYGALPGPTTAEAATAAAATASGGGAPSGETIVAPLAAAVFHVILALRARAAVTSAASAFADASSALRSGEGGAGGRGGDMLAEIDDVGAQLLTSLNALSVGAPSAGGTAAGWGRSAVTARAAAAGAPFPDLPVPPPRLSFLAIGAGGGASSRQGAVSADRAPLQLAPGDAWSPSRTALELALLSYLGHYQQWHARYRAAAEGVKRAEALLRELSAGGAGGGMRDGGARHVVIGDSSYAEAPARSPSGPVLRDGAVFFDDAAAQAAAVVASTEAWWRSMPLGELQERVRDERSRNLLLALCDSLGAGMPHEVLDVGVAKTLDNLRFAGAPAGVLSASLSLLHELAVGVTVIVGSTSGASLGLNKAAVAARDPLQALLANAGLTGSLGDFYCSGGGGGDDGGGGGGGEPVSVGDDLLRTACIKALLRRPAALLFPALRAPRYARLRSLLYGTVTRLLFLHARAVTKPERGLLAPAGGRGGTSAPPPSAVASGGSVSVGGVHTMSALALPLPLGAPASGRAGGGASPLAGAGSGDDAWLFDGSGGGSSWFSSFVEPVTAATRALRGAFGLAPAGDMPYSLAASVGVHSGSALSSAGLPEAALKWELVGWLRDVRGILSAASTPAEFRLVHDWLVASGAWAVIALAVHVGSATAAGASISSCFDVWTPLLRAVCEWATGRGGRIAFPPDTPAPYVLAREVGHAVIAVGAGVAVLRARVAAAPATPSGFPGEAQLLKAERLVLSGASRLLLGRFANAGVMGAYGDATLQDLWRAALHTLVGVPARDLAGRPKLAREVFGAAHALLFVPLPPLPPGSGGAAAAILGGLAETANPFTALTTSLPCPRAVATLMLQPSPVFVAFIARVMCVLDAAGAASPSPTGRGSALAALLPGSAAVPGQRIGVAAILHALAALEAVLTLDAEARTLHTRLRALAARSSRGVGDEALARALVSPRLCTVPSGSQVSPLAAAGIVAAMDAHARADLGPRDAAAAARAFAASLGGAPSGASGMPDAAPTSEAGGCFGVPFVAALLLAGARDPLRFTWPVARVLLPTMLCRPAIFTAAAAGLAASCAPEHAEAVRAATGDLGAVAQDLGDEATSDEGKDAFARAFTRWARNVADKL